MSIRATLIMLSSKPGLPASREQSNLLTQRLRQLGFTVLSVGRFGVSVEADEALFEAMLGVPAPSHRGISLELHQPDARLAGLVSKVCVAAPMDCFAEATQGKSR